MWGGDGLAEPAAEVSPLTTEAVRWVAALGGQAPSLHNSQPWQFVWDGHSLDVYADWSRQLPVVDPDGRQLHVSCGAALFLARLALRSLGRAARVRLSDGPRDGVHGDAHGVRLARLSTEPAVDEAPSLEEWALLAAVPERRTTRSLFTSRQVPISLLADMMTAARTEGADLHLVEEPAVRAAVASTVLLADRAERARPGYRRELHEWTRGDRDLATDGVPQAAGGPRPVDPGPTDFVQRDFGSRTSHLTSEAPDLVVVILSTDDDEPQSWVRAGMALARILLVATCAGVAASLLNQPLDLPGSREMLKRQIGTPGFPQALLRVGYPEGQAPRTPRRPVDDFLTVTDDVTDGVDRAHARASAS